MENKHKTQKKKRPPRSLFENRCAFMLQDLITKVHENIIPPGSFLPSEAELGRQYSLSRSSVRKVLEQLEIHIPLSRHQGKGIRVGQKTHLKELLNPEGKVLIILPFEYKKSQQFFQTKNTLQAIEQELAKQHIPKELFTLKTPEQYNSQEILDCIEQQKIRIVIVLNEPHHCLEPLYDMLFLKNIAVLSVLNGSKNKNIATITVNNYQIGQLAAKEFIKHNYKKFYAVVPYGKFLSGSKDRVLGFSDYLKLNHIPFEESQIIKPELEEGANSDVQKLINTGRLAAQELLQKDNDRCAVFCIEDAIAQGFFEVSQEHNIAIPEQWGVMGCGNDVQFFELNLSTISKNTFLSGSLAGKVVGSYLNGELSDIWPIHYTIKPILSSRGTI